MMAWLKKNKISILVICCCLLVIAGVITGAVLGNRHSIDDTTPSEKVYTLMDLGSSGCVPCDNLQPVLSTLRTKYEGKINVLFYDVNRTTEGASLARQYKVQYIPTLIFLDENGAEVNRIVGFQSQEQLEASFRSLGWME